MIDGGGVVVSESFADDILAGIFNAAKLCLREPCRGL